MSTQLSAPVITAEITDRVNIRISGLSVEHASAYQLRWGTLSGGGRVDTIQADADGGYTLDGCRARTTYYIAARALGDDEDYANSGWSAEVVVVTGQVVDSSLPVPVITLGSTSYTTATFSGFSVDSGYRFQLAIDPLLLDHENPRVAGAGTGGSFILQGLQPGTTYYVRFCSTSPHQKCSLWSDVLSFQTTAANGTATVTNNNDTGAGSLRQTIANATDGTVITFDSSLSGSTITLGSTLNLTKAVIVDGSTLDEPITIDFSGVAARYITCANITWKAVKFANAVLSANARSIAGGSFVDCSFVNFTNSYSNHSVYGANLYRCVVSGFSQNSTGYSLTESNIDSCVLSGNSGGMSSVCSIVNSYISGNNIQTRRNINLSVILNSIITENTGSGAGMMAYGSTAIETDFLTNTNTNAGGSFQGGLIATNLRDCRVEDNQNTANTQPVVGAANTNTTFYDSVFKNNKTVGACGVYTGSYIRCIVDEPSDKLSTSGAGVFVDCLFTAIVPSGSHTNCTIRKLTGGSAANSLLGPGSTIGTENNNVVWSDNPSSDYYYDKIFVGVENGDYRLKVDSPVIGQGSNEYVEQGDLDLAGNPRIAGDTVDVGCYEFDPLPLATPTFTIAIQTGGQINITYSLPDYADGFVLQYASSPDFVGAHEVSSTATSFDLTGLSGDVWLRAKSVGLSGKTLDSDWTEASRIYVDTTAPIIVVDRTPIEMTVADTVNFLAGVVVTDDAGGECSVHYQVLDRHDQPISVDGQTEDVVSYGIPKGNYKLVITATDAAGNVGTADRGLVVLPPRLPAPTLTLRSVSGTTVVLAGLTNLFASGWQLDHNGTVSAISPDAAGYFVLENLAENVTHVFKARALGDFIQPEPPATMSGDHRDSDWSDAVSVTILPPQPPVGAFWQWRTEPLMSHNGRIRQNVALRARIFDARSGELLPPEVVTGAEFTCWRLNADGTRTAVTGFDTVAVPNSAFSAAADDDGFNFTYIPDQTSTRMFAAAGRYELVVAVQLASGNPFDIYSNELTVF